MEKNVKKLFAEEEKFGIKKFETYKNLEKRFTKLEKMY